MLIFINSFLHNQRKVPAAVTTQTEPQAVLQVQQGVGDSGGCSVAPVIVTRENT